MSLIEMARKTLESVALSDVVRERMSLVVDQLAEAEKKLEETKGQLARTEAKLEIECDAHKKTRDEWQRLKEEHAEETRIHRAIEFRRGKRTGGKWLPFCPKCHMPAGTLFGEVVISCTGHCGWDSAVVHTDLNKVIAELSL